MSRRVTLLLPAVVTVATASLIAPAALSATANTPADEPLRREISRIMADPSMTTSSAQTTFTLFDGSNADLIWSRGSTVPLMPASTLKLFTAAAGLNYLGSGYRWPSEVWSWPMRSGGVVPGNLYLKGYGDPTLTEARLATMAASLKAKGVRRIAGSVMADTSAWDNQRYNPHWSTSYRSEYYAAQVSAVTLAPDTDYDAGTIIVNYSPGATSGAPPRLTVTPASAASYVRLVNTSRTSAKGSASTFTATRSSGSNTITLKGQVPLGRATAKRWVTVNDPGALAASVLRAQLLKAGITVDGGSGRMTRSAGTVLYSRTSSALTLGQLLVPFLKLSNNGHAEAITKTIGARYGRPGNWSDGTAAISRYASGLGISMSGSRFVDGSGLSRNDRVTSSQMLHLLYRIQSASWFPTFKAALPVAGADPVRWTGGTLASRMRGTPAANRLHAKNGDLTGVSSLAGYVSGADGRRYIFALISNYTATSSRAVEDRVGVLLGGWRMSNR